MTRTRPLTLVLFAVLGGAAGWLYELILDTNGEMPWVPSVALGLVLLVIAIINIGLAIPIRRAVRDRTRPRVDPFHATRVVVLAKASAISGSLMAGAGVGVLVFLLTRPVMPATSQVGVTIASTVGAVLLFVAGLVAEYLCSVPPDDEDNNEPPTATVRPH